MLISLVLAPVLGSNLLGMTTATSVMRRPPPPIARRHHAPAYSLRAFLWHGSQVRVLSMNGGNGYAIRSENAAPCLSMVRLSPGQIALRHGGVASVNGDFIGVPGGPQHTLYTNGVLWTTGTAAARLVRVPRSYSLSCTPPPQPAPVLHPRTPRRAPRPIGIQTPGFDGLFMATAGDSHAWIVPTPRNEKPDIRLRTQTGTFDIQSFNGAQPYGAALVAFNVRGGGITYPYSRSCWARIRHGRVEAIAKSRFCLNRPILVGAGGTVVGGWPVRQLRLGEQVRFRISFIHPGIVDAFGGRPILVWQGRNIVHYTGTAGGSLYRLYHPRTGLGLTKGCTDGGACRVFLVTVDGRQPGWSQGQQMYEWAELMRSLGAWEALNFDGGGSTLMWTQHKTRFCSGVTPVLVGCVVNRPSNGGNGLDAQRQAHGIRPTMTAMGIYRVR